MVKSVRLADIAEKVGVSVVTVSKALSDQKGVSEEMREKIKILAKEMGYKSIHSIESEQRKKSITIGVISLERYFSQFNSFYWKMYQEVATKAVKKNCFTMLEVISSQAEMALQPPKLFDEDSVDAILVIGKPDEEYLEVLSKKCKVPMIYMDFYDDNITSDAIISDGFYGSYMLTNYLIQNGHSRIAYVGTVKYSASILDRYLGYYRALYERGMDIRDEWIIDDRDIEIGKIGEAYEMKLPSEMPTAFVCNCDLTAYHLIRLLEKKGYRVPEDISVVGFDNYLYPEYGNSTITTYEVDIAEMSRLAIKELLKSTEESGDRATGIRVVPGRIIIRSSVKTISYKE